MVIAKKLFEVILQISLFFNQKERKIYEKLRKFFLGSVSMLIPDSKFRAEYEPILIHNKYYWRHIGSGKIVEFYKSEQPNMVLEVEVDIKA